MSGRSYVGDIYIGLYDNAGNFTGYIDHLINTTTLSFTAPEVETVNRLSKRRQDPGQTLDQFQESTGESTMALTTDEAIPDIMAMALLGRVVDVDITSGSATGESVTFYHDKWVKLKNVNITDETLDIDDGQSGSFSEGTDYEVDLRKGMVKALSGGGMDDATAYDCDYDYTALEGYKIVGHTQRNTRIRVFGDMEDQATGQRGEIEVFDARARPSDAVNFIQDQAFLEAALECGLVTPSDQSGPFTFREIKEA